MGKPRKTKKIKFAVYTQNNGDGSASARFFKNEKLAEKVAERDDERFCEDIATHELVIDMMTGEVLSGIETTADED